MSQLYRPPYIHETTWLAETHWPIEKSLARLKQFSPSSALQDIVGSAATVDLMFKLFLICLAKHSHHENVSYSEQQSKIKHL